MGFSCMKSKLILFNAYGTFCWNKIESHQGLIQEAISGFNPFSRAVLSRVVNRVPVSSVICLFGSGAKYIHSQVFLDIGRRFYHSNPYPLYNPMPRAIMPLPQSFRKPPWVTFLIASCVVIAVFSVKVERIPYTKRFHFVMSERIERKLGEFQWNKLKKENEGRILPPTDPRSIRVGSLAREIIRALHSGLRLERECSVLGYAPESAIMSKDIGRGTLIASDFGANVIERSEKRARKLRWKPATKHLDGMNWEVIVVDSYTCNALYVPPGKILVYKGLLRKFKSDAEIATIIGHEVGHGVARHCAEGLIKIVFSIILLFILAQFVPIDGYANISKLVQISLLRRREVEADHIGLMLMASAGYDPREVPKVYERLDDSEKDDFFSTHPCGRKRCKWLNKTKVMEEALAIYNEVRSGCGVRSFI